VPNSRSRADRRIWLNAHRNRQTLRKKVRKARNKTRFLRLQRLLRYCVDLGKRVSLDKANRITLVLPAQLDFDSNYENTCRHFHILRRAIEWGIRIKKLDFGELEQISTSAALVLVSTVDQWRRRVRRPLTADFQSWNPEVVKLLCEMGYCEALRIRRPDRIDSGGAISFVPFKSGRISNLQKGKIAKELRIEIEAIIGEEIDRGSLYEGLSEAITNVSHHAYKTIFDVARQFWWVSGSYNARTRELSVSFYDRGSGIPKRIVKNKRLEHMWDAMGQWTDSKKIEAAMQLGRTSTDLDERGKGLQNFVSFAIAHKYGKIKVRSLRGLYEEEHIGREFSGHQRFVRMVDYKESIGGTLIEWLVKI
jgi:hypothetical protein